MGRAGAASDHLPLTVKVGDRRMEADGIVGLDLVPVDRGDLPGFIAGSHIDVGVCSGIIRQYSLCNSPTDRRCYRIAVLREPNSAGGSVFVHEKLAVGDVIQIGEPKNRFALVESAHHSLLVAGGVGITPLLSMAQYLEELGRSFELHYYARSPKRMAFRQFICSSSFASKATLHFTEGRQPRALGLESLLDRPLGDTHLYVCGPAGFIGAVLDVARRSDWSDAQLHREYFAADSSAESRKATSFKVRVASSGAEFEVPEDQTVVSVLARAGIVIPTFCEQGTCGTCLTRVIAGIPDHRDVVLSEEERARADQFTPCCSRSKSQLLVLDL